MAVSTTLNRTSYTADGMQTTFAYPFEIFANTDLQVYDNGVLKTLTTHYTVTGAGSLTGGNVVFGAAPTAGHTILIVRVLPYTQASQLPNNGSFPSATVETMVDRNVMMVQQLAEVDQRSIKLPLTSAFTNLTVPDPVSGKQLRWKTDLTGLENFDGIAGPAGATGPQGPAGAGAAPAVQEADGSPSIAVPTVIQFDQNDGFVVTNPGGAGVAQIDLDHTATGRSLVTAASAAAAATVIGAPTLSGDNAFTGREKLAKGANLTAGATLTPGTDGNYFTVTGNTTITAIASLQAGTIINLVFSGIPLLTHNGTSLILQGSVNYQTVAGDVFTFISEGGGNWRELSRRLAAATAAGSSGALTKVTANTSFSNSAAENTLFTYADGGNVLGTNNKYRLTAYIGVTSSNADGTPTLTLRFKYGTTTLATVVGSNGDGGGQGITSGRMPFVFEVAGDGATNAQIGGFVSGFTFIGNGGPSQMKPTLPGDNTGASLITATEDSTTSKNVVLTAQHSLASPTTVVTLYHAVLEKIA